ncbi:N-6 DNA methylase [Vibrio coralliilyticus]|uniref:N-6 DNA methylase n=1 Tax=Vibrio coralliilyticus TaxID=190893 RepID=UPI0006924276|nr:N-6 DNA methylase [Vibrio coralliilyticus]
MTSSNNIHELESHILKAAEVFRGYLEPRDVKGFVLATVFLKYISEVFEFKTQELLCEMEAHSEIDKGKFVIPPCLYDTVLFLPEEARWSYVISQSDNLIQYLDKALYLIERQEESLKGVRALLPSASKVAVSEQDVSSFLMRLNAVSLFDHSSKGEVFEHLLKMFADSSGKKGSEFYTPSEVANLLVRILKPTKGMTIYDPVVGTGGMLVQSINYIREKEDTISNIGLYGQDINYTNAVLARLNIFIHGYLNANVSVGDTIKDPQFFGFHGGVQQFDRVIANPPFSVKSLGNDGYYNFPYRFKYGIPPKSSADLAFVMHMIASMKPNGIAGTIVPHGVLFRGNSEGAIRRAIVEEDLIEAIIGLPHGLFYGTGIPACILILNKNKCERRKGNILFIDASNSFESMSSMNKLRQEDIEKIVRSFESFESNSTYSKVVDFSTIRENNFNLSIRKYVDDSEASKRINSLLKHHDEFRTYKLSDQNFASSITIAKQRENSESLNAIYVYRRATSNQVQLFLECSDGQLRNYFRIEFNSDLLIKAYAQLYFQSELGRLVLSHLPTGTSLPSLSKEYIESLEIPVPSIEIQKEVVRIASKLQIAKSQIDTFFSKLTTEPKQYKVIEDNTNSMVYSLSSLSDATHLKQLIALGETRQMEFKQSFFANVDKIRGTDIKIERDSEVQGEVLKDVASFMNTEGGTLLIGVNDKGKVTGVELELKRFKWKKMDNYFQELGAQLESRLGRDYHQFCKLTEVEIDGRIVAQIDCKPAPFPIFLDNEKFHVRTDTSSPALKGMEMIRYMQNHFKMTLTNDQQTHPPAA